MYPIYLGFSNTWNYAQMKNIHKQNKIILELVAQKIVKTKKEKSSGICLVVTKEHQVLSNN